MLSNNFDKNYVPIVKPVIIKYPIGYKCSVTNENGYTVNSYDLSGTWNFIFPQQGLYEIICETALGTSILKVFIDDTFVPNSEITIQESFSYTGTVSHDTLDSPDIYLFTKTGKLTLKEDCVVDVCLVGGGNNGSSTSNGNGGQGGQVVHQYGVSLKANTPYDITIAAAGGTTSAFGYSANNKGVAGGRGSSVTGNYNGEKGKTGTYLFGNTNFKAYGASGGGGGGYSDPGTGGYYGGGNGGISGSPDRKKATSAYSYGGGGGGNGSEEQGTGSGYQGALFIRKHQ